MCSRVYLHNNTHMQLICMCKGSSSLSLEHLWSLLVGPTGQSPHEPGVGGWKGDWNGRLDISHKNLLLESLIMMFAFIFFCHMIIIGQRSSALFCTPLCSNLNSTPRCGVHIATVLLVEGILLHMDGRLQQIRVHITTKWIYQLSFEFCIVCGWRTPHHLSHTRGYISPRLLVEAMP